MVNRWSWAERSSMLRNWTIVQFFERGHHSLLRVAALTTVRWVRRTNGTNLNRSSRTKTSRGSFRRLGHDKLVTNPGYLSGLRQIQDEWKCKEIGGWRSIYDSIYFSRTTIPSSSAPWWSLVACHHQSSRVRRESFWDELSMFDRRSPHCTFKYVATPTFYFPNR